MTSSIPPEAIRRAVLEVRGEHYTARRVLLECELHELEEFRSSLGDQPDLVREVEARERAVKRELSRVRKAHPER